MYNVLFYKLYSIRQKVECRRLMLKIVQQSVLTLRCAGARADQPPTGQHRGEGLCEGLPALHLPVPLRELLRALQQRVPGKELRAL